MVKTIKIKPVPPRGRIKGSPVQSLAISLFVFALLLVFFDPDLASDHPSVVDEALERFRSGSKPLDSIVTTFGDKKGREPILNLLNEAGITNLSDEQVSSLPLWENVEQLYGPNVVVVGKNRCQDFQAKVPFHDRLVAPAGLFNTGTNLLELLLMRNIEGVKSLWQVPWGKHRMPAAKWNNTAEGLDQYPKENVLPVVMVRDPFAWLHSMCNHPYAATWRHAPGHCPNLVPNQRDAVVFDHVKKSFHVTVKYDQDTHVVFDSLIHFWSEYHRQYFEADYPVLLVRFEDLVFQPRLVLSEIAECLGGSLREPLQYQVKSSKSHGSGTDYVKAIIKTADASLRLHNMTQEDLEFAQEHLDANMMNIFRYRGPFEKIELRDGR